MPLQTDWDQVDDISCPECGERDIVVDRCYFVGGYDTYVCRECDATWKVYVPTRIDERINAMAESADSAHDAARGIDRNVVPVADRTRPTRYLWGVTYCGPRESARPAELLDFSRAEVGRIEEFCRASDVIGLPDEPMLIVLAANEGKPAADDDPDADKIVGVLEWHADTMYVEVPTRGALLQAVTLPKVGGNTAWIDRHEVFKALPKDIQDKIRPLKIRYSYEKSHRSQGVAKQGEILFPDVISQLLLAVPMYLLFEGSLVLMRLTEKRRKAVVEKPEEPQSAS